MKIEQTAEATHVLIREARTPGAWGKGKTVAEAAKNVRANGARNGCVSYIMAVDADAYIDDMGDLQRTHRGPIYKGKLHNTGVTITEKDRD